MSVADDELRDRLGIAWHDVTCPEGPNCRSRYLHATTAARDVVELIQRAVQPLLGDAWAAGYLEGDPHQRRGDPALAPNPYRDEIDPIERLREHFAEAPTRPEWIG